MLRCGLLVVVLKEETREKSESMISLSLSLSPPPSLSLLPSDGVKTQAIKGRKKENPQAARIITGLLFFPREPSAPPTRDAGW